MRYNSPFVMVASVCMFQWMATFSFQSIFINKVAKSVLSVYVISSMIPGYYDGLHWVQNHTGYWGTAILMPIFIAAYYAACIVIDQVRIIVCRPLIMLLVDKTDKLTNKG